MTAARSMEDKACMEVDVAPGSLVSDGKDGVRLGMG